MADGDHVQHTMPSILGAVVGPAGNALASGATDFLTKPCDQIEVRLRVGNPLRTQVLHLALLGHAETLEQQVHERTTELDRAWLETLTSLVLAMSDRHPSPDRCRQAPLAPECYALLAKGSLAA